MSKCVGFEGWIEHPTDGVRVCVECGAWEPEPGEPEHHNRNCKVGENRRPPFILAVPAPVLGGFEVAAAGSFDEMIAEADRLDPDYSRGLRVLEMRDRDRRVPGGTTVA